MLVTLSTKEVVTMKDRFTHQAEKIYSAAREKGVVDKEYTEDDADGQPKVKIVRERPTNNYAEAAELTLLHLIESVDGKPATMEWLGNVLEPDYEQLVEALVQVRKQTRESIEAGKKNH